MRGFKTKSASTSRFAMVPRQDVPRSVFRAEQTHKTTFDAGLLVPIYVDEVLPGDSVNLNMTAFVRMMTPLFPIMDNLYLDTHFFFVPNRLVWNNWQEFMGEQDDPEVLNVRLIPQIEVPLDSPAGSIWDYMGVPVTPGSLNTVNINALPLRAYNLVYNEWYRTEYLIPKVAVHKGDGPDPAASYTLLRRGKRHDYFTSALPWPMRDVTAQGTPGDALWRGGAPVSGVGAFNLNSTASPGGVFETGGRTVPFAAAKNFNIADADNTVYMKLDAFGYPDVRVTIADMRLAYAAQRFMEKDSRGGTRYTEIIRQHFGVVSPDARMQRPEYLGGGTTPISVTPITQNSAQFDQGAGNLTTPLGTLGGVGTAVATNNRFSQSFTEHGYIIGIASIRADLTYQQGINRMWTRRTKFDFYWPAFAQLGEQAVLRKEIYATGGATDNTVFGYQERYAEYRNKPNRLSGRFRSVVPGTLDAWHLAQNFGVAPVLGATFINENPPMARVLSEIALPGQQFLFDGLFSVKHVRPIPVWSIPGLGDRF